MQSNAKVIQGLVSKIQSPLQQIRNRAITTLYTKVSAKIITQVDLAKSKQLPGVLFHWINQNTPMNKDCLFKVLSILHRYTLIEEGLGLLVDYEGLQFLEEFRKFLLANETNVDEHCDIIKKIIKSLLPLENNRVKGKSNEDNLRENEDEGEQFNGNANTKKLTQQKADDSDNQDQKQFESTKHKSSAHQNKRQNKNTKQRNIISFYSMSEDLPKAIDQQLYSLMIQLKHGKKQSVLETLIKIEEIGNFWGNRYFKYKEELVREIVTVIEGKVHSEVGCRILAVLFKQLLEMQADMGIDQGIQGSSYGRNYIRTSKLSSKGINSQFHKVEIELKFQIFGQNPFSHVILQALITKNTANMISSSLIEYLLVAVSKYQFSGAFLPYLLQKISNNNLWLSQKLYQNKFYQSQLIQMINHCCVVQSDVYPQVIPYLPKLFPNLTLEQISSKIPNLSAQLHQQQIQRSFEVLIDYSQTKGNSLQKEGFDFNLQLHQLQTHIKNLQKGITGLPKKPQIISLYIDCLLMLAISVAKQDPLMSYYPKIKSLILKISQHQYLNCRMGLFDSILLVFNSSEKINYLAQSFLKSQVIRLVFTDAEFYQQLLVTALNQQQTIGTFLQITKLIQSTTKEQNRKYLNKFSPVFYILSNHQHKQKSSAISNPIAINSSAKIILSRLPKKHQPTNILLSLFSNYTQQRLRTYKQILGLTQGQDLLKICLQYKSQPQKKPLKYSLSTIRNYMNIIMNQKIQSSIKASAIDQMIECSQRIDMILLQKDDQFMKEILLIRSSVQTYIKDFIQKAQQGQQLMFFIQVVRIYSILQKRLRLQTNSLNQVIKPSVPEFYLNVLINICGGVNAQTLSHQKFRNIIPEFMTLIYYHAFWTFTSLLLIPNNKLKDFKKNIIYLHWITEIYPHQQLIKGQNQQVSSIAKRTELFSVESQQKQSKENDKLIDTFLKGYKLNIKSQKQLISLYVQKISDSQPINSETWKLRRNIICPILQRQLSTAIHSITSCQGQLAFLNFMTQNITPLTSQQQKHNFFEPLQQMTPHIMNQLLKPNVPEYVKIMLINTCNAIGWKRTKMFDGVLNQINPNELNYLKLIHKLPKLSTEELSKIIKNTLTNVDSITTFPSTCLLWKILIKPANLKTLILSSTQYTQLLVLNSLIKTIQHEISDQRLINFSIILLHQILNQLTFELKKLPSSALTDFNQFEQNKETQKVVQMLKLIMSLSIVPNIISFILQKFQKNSPYETNRFTLENLCFLLQALKTSLSLTNFAAQHSLSSESNLAHQNKLIKLFIIQLNEYIRSNPQMLSLPSLEIFFSSVLNFVNSLTKTQNFSQSVNQVDLLDMALNLFYEKTKLMTKKQPYQKLNKNTPETLLLFCSILEYTFLKIQSEPSEISHYLLSSTTIIEATINLLSHFQKAQSQGQLNSKTKTYLKQVLQKLGKVLHRVSLHQEDYFIFKLNQLCQQKSTFNLLQTFGSLAAFADENFMICFMRLVLIWQGHQEPQKSNSKTAQFQALNPAEFFDQEEDDSSLEERQLFQTNNKTSKNPHKNSWIQTVIDIAVQRNQVRHCKSILALSLPAKMFLIEKPSFYQYLKKISNLIDSKIIYETTTGKKKPIKKSTLVNNNSSVMLSNSRRTVMSQNLSTYDDSIKNSTQEQKLIQIEEFTKVLIALFAVNEGLLRSQKLDHYVNVFTSHLNKFKQVLRKVFYIVDRLYTLSEALVSSLPPNKQFAELFMKLINALSESGIFSQSLSNHLTEGMCLNNVVVSPMLEQSLSTILKGMGQPLYQQDSEKIKQAIKLLTTLSNHESVRSYIYKNKLIEELNSRIVKYEQKKNEKTDFLNMNSLYDIVGFYLNLSHFKDSHSKILNDKKVLEVLVNQVYMQKSSLLSQKILELLSNLSAYKLNKPVFMQNRQIHKTVLGQLESDQVEYKSHLLTLMYNLIYRHAPGVKLYKRKDVVEMLENIHWEQCENWDHVKHIFAGLMQVLTSQSEIPDKN